MIGFNEIEIFDETLWNNCQESLSKKIDFNKKSKKGEVIISFSDAILDYNIINDTSKVKLRIPVGNTSSMRIDNIAIALCKTSYDDFYKIKVVRTRQL